MTSGAAPTEDPVDASADLFKAIWPGERDDEGTPTSEPFRRNNSYDASTRCTVAETGARFETSYIAVVPCAAFLRENIQPVHAPTPSNTAHVLAPGKLTRSVARKIAKSVSAMHSPIAPRA